MEKLETAIHEAGHTVAHCRLSLDFGFTTIKPTEGKFGSLSGEGTDHVWDAKRAQDMVLAYCAGYAAVIAAGRPVEKARAGCDDDFEHASELITFWKLPGDLDDWKKSAVELMSKPENVRAVEFVTKKLLVLETIAADHLMVLVEVADGASTEEDYERYLAFLKAAGC
jgi:hypothetical protein